MPRREPDEGEAYRLQPALDAAHRVGSVVVKALVREWAKYRDVLPE